MFGTADLAKLSRPAPLGSVYAVCASCNPVDIKKLFDVVEIIDFTNDYNTATALTFAHAILKLDPEMPVVLSHGTNIIPEVAFLLDLVLDRPAPVVVTGSMRPMSSVRIWSTSSLLEQRLTRLVARFFDMQVSGDARCMRAACIPQSVGPD